VIFKQGEIEINMKNILYGIVTFAMSFAVNSSPIINGVGLSSPSSTITFDEFVLATGTSVDAQYSSLGVTFTPGLNYSPLGSAISFPGITGNHIGNFTNFSSASTVNPYSIFFTSNQTEAAIGYATSTPAQSTFSAFLGGVLVESFMEVTTYATTPSFYGFENILFDEIRVQSNDVAIMDNIQFGNISNVPAPPALWLIGSSLIGLIGMKRRTAKVSAL